MTHAPTDAAHSADQSAPRKELTLRGLILGALITGLFTAANVFLGLKVGLTFATSIPAAVISMAILKGFKSSTIQENNIVQTVASAAGTLSAVIFVLPGLMIIGWWSQIQFWPSFAICALGGLLGVMYSIPLRRALVTDSDLPYPEGVAAAEVLQVGAGSKAETPEAIAESKAGVRVLVAGSFTSGLFALLKAMRAFADEPTKVFKLAGGLSRWNPGFSFALLGVGHLVGISVGLAMLVGLCISWVAAVPYFTHLAHVTVPDADGAKAVAKIFKEQVRYLGAGSIGVAAVWTLLKLIVPVWGGLTSAVRASKRRGGGEVLPRTEQDMPIGLVGMITLLSLVPLSVLFTTLLRNGPLAGFTVELVVAAVAYVVIIGLLVAAVVGYMAGLIGASNSPLSGIGILAIVGFASLLAHWIQPQVGPDASKSLMAFALFVTAVVFTVGTIANDNLQDLKTGQLVDATPWKQQASLVFGVLAGAVVIPPVLMLLAKTYGFAGVEGAGPQALGAPQANLIADLDAGIIAGRQHIELLYGIYLGLALVVVDEALRLLKLIRIPPLAVGLGIYLPMSSTLFVVIGSAIGWVYEKLVDRTPSGEVAKRLGVLLASGLIVGESLFGVVNAGIVAAAQTGLLWMPRTDPHAEAPLAPDLFSKWVDTDGALYATAVVFLAITAALYVWLRGQAKAAKG